MRRGHHSCVILGVLSEERSSLMCVILGVLSEERSSLMCDTRSA